MNVFGVEHGEVSKAAGCAKHRGKPVDDCASCAKTMSKASPAAEGAKKAVQVAGKLRSVPKPVHSGPGSARAKMSMRAWESQTAAAKRGSK